MTAVTLIVSVFACSLERHGDMTRDRSYIRAYRAFEFISALPVVITAAVRYDVGTDYLYTYVPMFHRISMGMETHYEPGFLLLNKLVLLVTDDAAWLFVLCSVLIYGLIFYVIYDISPAPYYSILLFIITTNFFVSMNIMRQFIAIALFMYAFKYIRSRSQVRFWLCILLAATFHVSILLALPMYYIGSKRLASKKGLVVIAAAVLVTPLLRTVLSSLFSATRYASYFNSVFDDNSTAYRLLFINLAVLLLGYVYKDRGEHHSETYEILLNMQYVSTLICACSAAFPLAYRVVNNFSVFQILLIPMAVSRERRPLLRWGINAAIILAFTVLTVVTIFINGEHAVVPYKTVFNML